MYENLTGTARDIYDTGQDSPFAEERVTLLLDVCRAGGKLVPCGNAWRPLLLSYTHDLRLLFDARGPPQ